MKHSCNVSSVIGYSASDDPCESVHDKWYAFHQRRCPHEFIKSIRQSQNGTTFWLLCTTRYPLLTIMTAAITSNTAICE